MAAPSPQTATEGPYDHELESCTTNRSPVQDSRGGDIVWGCEWHGGDHPHPE